MIDEPNRLFCNVQKPQSIFLPIKFLSGVCCLEIVILQTIYPSTKNKINDKDMYLYTVSIASSSS